MTHLDGRGIKLNVHQPKGKVLKPGQVLKIAGEGMPIKKSDVRGDLYLAVNIEFPKDGWIKNEEVVKRIRGALPGRAESEGTKPETVDEAEIEYDATLDDFGADSDDPRGGGEWEDEDEEGGPQCATQ